ncbi:flagellar basal body protein [Antarcticimicrobium luteum]|uniref:Flagellar basal body rod protein n=1 Tax=Antarcticimicrobium luteum TaxID=2547397 RepID=A0A4R5VD04_9RHOB|nr:flagellar basal body protein [Antarcticimicrobium luteum]TDK50204.1 flagellar basal body rod protein [Antarcticimicrobium luteum]
MNLDNINLFQLASRRLQWLADRQKVVSENIANADTAGYRAREVEDFASYMDRADRAEGLPKAAIEEVEATWAEAISGNNVVLEEQILQASNAAGQYKLASNLYRKAHEMVLAVSGSR